MEKRMIYEHLVCKACECERMGVYYANANLYDSANTLEKQKELLTYIKVSLANLLVGGKVKPEQKDMVQNALNKLDKIEYIESVKKGSFLIDEVLEEIEICTY